MSENKHNEIKILGISIWKLFVYFIIYGFAGYVVETLFALATMGVWECRQSFLYGPFLGVYGIGAVCIILFSQYFKKNNFSLFLGGCVIGSVTEYIVSFGTEILIGTRWWDYSDKILNINGRVCLLYSIFWGILTVFLVKLVNPKIDKLCTKIQNKISRKILKIVTAIIMTFLCIDCVATIFAQEQFIARMVIDNNINVSERDYNKYKKQYDYVKQNKVLDKIIQICGNDEKMVLTFPNMKIKDKDENVIYLKDLLPEAKSYYWKKD